MRRGLALALALSCTMPLASAGPSETSIDVVFPDSVGELHFDKRFEFPQKALGVNIRYKREGPVIGSIYVYNSGLAQIPSGTENPVVRRHFSQVIDEVRQLEAIGKVRSIRLSETPEQVTNYEGCGPQFIWRGYDMDLSEGVLTSFTYLTAMKDNFVKLRISYRKGDAQGPRQADQFVREIRKVLGHCV